MKIYVKSHEERRPIHIYLPNSLIFSKLCAKIIFAGLKETASNELPLTQKEIYILLHSIKASVEACGHFNLVHVESEDGDIVDIDL